MTVLWNKYGAPRLFSTSNSASQVSFSSASSDWFHLGRNAKGERRARGMLSVMRVNLISVNTHPSPPPLSQWPDDMATIITLQTACWRHPPWPPYNPTSSEAAHLKLRMLIKNSRVGERGHLKRNISTASVRVDEWECDATNVHHQCYCYEHSKHRVK